jgi:molybdopterin synthase sulfur carrier subunit
MPQKVRIPEPLRNLTNNQEFVEVNAATIGDVILELQSKFPGITEWLTDKNGEIRRFTSFYVNDEDIRFLQNRETPLKDGDQISIIPPLIDNRSAQAAIDVANRLRAGEKLIKN